MRNRTITFSLLAIVIGIFGLYVWMTAASLRRSDTPGKELPRIAAAADLGNWIDAAQAFEGMETYWEAYKHWLMLNYAAENFNTFDEKLASLRRALTDRNEERASERAEEALYYWNNMMKLMPQP